MYKKIKDLNNKFKIISNKGYIKAISNNSSAVGLTFEKELNIPKNEFWIPDYNGIEIKTKCNNSKRKDITLFSVVPDGENLFEIDRLRNKYGYPFKNNKKLKVLRLVTSGKEFNKKGLYLYKLINNKQKERIYLNILTSNYLHIESKVYWSYNCLKERLFSKLKYLALVKAERKQINNHYYYHYTKIDFYKLKDFNTFLTLLENGKIKLVFNVGVHLDKKRYGHTHNHGCNFTINENDINLLFNKYDIT